VTGGKGSAQWSAEPRAAARRQGAISTEDVNWRNVRLLIGSLGRPVMEHSEEARGRKVDDPRDAVITG
jgi:hypothetical protein